MRRFSRQSISYEALLEAITEASSSAPRRINQIHALVITNGFSSKSVLACRLIGCYASTSGLEDAHKVFEFLPKRTPHIYNHMLKAYVDHDQYQLAFKLYSQILFSQHVSPDPVTFSLVLKVCMGLGSLWEGKMIHAHVLLMGSNSDLRVSTDLLCLYSKCGCMSFARNLFDLIPQRDVFVWTAVIDGYMRSGEHGEALHLFHSMRESGLKANSITWNALLAGFTRDGLIHEALSHINLMQLDGVRPDNVSLCTVLPLFAKFSILKPGVESHAYVMRHGFEFDLFVVSALVDMYAKCGMLELARRVFDRVESKDTGVWNSIIAGCGMHGNCEEVLSLFDKMIDSDIGPNEITFASVLFACSHAGLVSEGRRVFNKMAFDYKIAARHEHYACMVDMLGRAGHLEEALKVIWSMPFEPTEDIWGTFLSACRIHSDVKFVEIATQNMFERSKSDGNARYHVMLSNIYAEGGRWGDMARLRTQIRDVGLKGRAGYSWIEVGDNVHTFSMADMSNPHADEICSLLRNINAAISSATIS